MLPSEEEFLCWTIFLSLYEPCSLFFFLWLFLFLWLFSSPSFWLIDLWVEEFWWLHLISWSGYMHMTFTTYLYIHIHSPSVVPLHQLRWVSIHTHISPYLTLPISCLYRYCLIYYQSFCYIDWAVCIGSERLWALCEHLPTWKPISPIDTLSLGYRAHISALIIASKSSSYASKAPTPSGEISTKWRRHLLLPRSTRTRRPPGH